jgi:hypothetical protein
MRAARCADRNAAKRRAGACPRSLSLRYRVDCRERSKSQGLEFAQPLHQSGWAMGCRRAPKTPIVGSFPAWCARATSGTAAVARKKYDEIAAPQITCYVVAINSSSGAAIKQSAPHAHRRPSGDYRGTARL